LFLQKILCFFALLNKSKHGKDNTNHRVKQIKFMVETRLAQIDADLVACRASIESLKESVSEIKQQTSFTQSFMSKKEFAKLCGISVATVSRRLAQGCYDTPKGCTLRAFYNQGNQGNAIFNAALALQYFEQNNSTINAPRQPTD